MARRGALCQEDESHYCQLERSYHHLMRARASQAASVPLARALDGPAQVAIAGRVQLASCLLRQMRVCGSHSGAGRVGTIRKDDLQDSKRAACDGLLNDCWARTAQRHSHSTRSQAQNQLRDPFAQIQLEAGKWNGRQRRKQRQKRVGGAGMAEKRGQQALEGRKAMDRVESTEPKSPGVAAYADPPTCAL